MLKIKDKKIKPLIDFLYIDNRVHYVFGQSKICKRNKLLIFLKLYIYK